jgi:hypothetical protein
MKFWAGLALASIGTLSAQTALEKSAAIITLQPRPQMLQIGQHAGFLVTATVRRFRKLVGFQFTDLSGAPPLGAEAPGSFNADGTLANQSFSPKNPPSTFYQSLTSNFYSGY